MAVTVTFNVGALPTPFCPVTWQQTFQGFVNALTGTVNGLSATGITVSTTAPSAGTAPNLWLQVSGSGVPIQLYSYNGTAGDWEPINPSYFFPGLTDSGAVNAYKVTVSPFPTAITPAGSPTSGLIKGMTFVFKAGATNTGASTYQVNAYAAGSILIGAAAIPANTIVLGNWYLLQYDGTNYQILNPDIGPQLPKTFTTTINSIPAADSGTETTPVAHGLGSTPSVIGQWLCNAPGDDDYQIGDQVPLDTVWVRQVVGGDDSDGRAAVPRATATNISVIWPGPRSGGTGTYFISGKTTGYGLFTPARWSLKLNCYAI